MVTAISLFIISCGGNNEPEVGQAQETTGQTQETEALNEHEHDEASETIELNNGEKWLVNNEMKPFVFKGQELVAGFLKNNESDYAVLANNVKEQNDQLIKSCTMKGKSHDELHKWLHPHLELVKELQETKDPAKAKNLVSKLDKSYQEYEKYFQ